MDRFQLFAEYFSLRAGGASWTVSVIGWAESLLDRADESEHLLILASLPPDSPTAEVRDYFDRALHDLGVEELDDVSERLGSARATAEALGRGTIGPIECAARIHDVVVSPLNHPSSLQEWCDLDSGFVTDESGMVRKKEGAELETEIRALAERFLSQDPSEQVRTISAERRPEP